MHWETFGEICPFCGGKLSSRNDSMMSVYCDTCEYDTAEPNNGFAEEVDNPPPFAMLEDDLAILN